MLCAIPSAAQDTVTATTAEQVKMAVGHALQADVRPAVDTLSALASEDLSAADRIFRDCMIGRFGQAKPTDGPAEVGSTFAQRLLQRYRIYWHQSVLNPEDRPHAEDRLRQALAQDFGTDDDWPTLEKEVHRRLASDRSYALLGQTGPLRELMIWTDQRKTVERVDLPDGAYEAAVIYLARFESLGWADWATCGRRGTGGWATSDALFAVTPRYESLSGEEFRVTFLGHETQHFADLRRFPGIHPWELEYRAKLTELAQVRTTRLKVLGKFLEDQSEDVRHPHSYANRKILSDLQKRLKLAAVNAILSVDPDLLNRTALELHREDTARRRALHR